MAGPWEKYSAEAQAKPADGPWSKFKEEATVPASQAKGFGAQLDDFISDVPRQVGLTARAGVQGVGNTLSALAAPLRVGVNAILPKSAQINSKPAGTALADAIGLPAPRTAGERVVGDAAGLMAGGALPILAGAGLASNTTGTAQRVGQLLASRPGQQMASAGAAGAAGGYTRETGGGEGAQAVAALAAGVGAPFAMAGAGRLATATRNATVGRATPTPQQIEITINRAIQDSGLNTASLPDDVAAAVRRDVAAAYKLGDDLSPDAIRRLADYRMTGLTPTRAKLTQDPAEITRQENLSKRGANSSDPAAQKLALTRNANNRQLTASLNESGAGTSTDKYAAGERITDALGAYDQRAQKLIGGLYDRARDNSGRSAQLDPNAFANKAGDLLHEANAESFLPIDIRSKLNAFAAGDVPLTVEIAEQFKTSIGRLQRNASDGNMRHALGLVRQALDDTPLASNPGPNLALPGAQDLGEGAIKAFNRARKVNRQYMQLVERTPALQAVRDGVQPDQFVQKFILGQGGKANVMDVAQLKNAIGKSPDAVAAVKGQIAAHLKTRALNGAADETGNFSQSAYKSALDQIGDRKLRMFFSQQEVDKLKAIGRAASYEQFQPAGSAVNNSGTDGARSESINRLLSNIPGISPLMRTYLAEPVQNIVVGTRSGTALNAPRSLLLPQIARPRNPAMVSPAALLGTESEEDRKRREAGLLFP